MCLRVTENYTSGLIVTMTTSPGPSMSHPTRSLSLSQPTYTPPRVPSTRHNPISLRIYKAIGTSFDDPGSREALEIASSFYAPSVKGKEKAEDHEDDGLPEGRSLKGQTAAMARKHLRRDVEGRLAGGSRKFLEAFGEVDKVSRVSSFYDERKRYVLRELGVTSMRSR